MPIASAVLHNLPMTDIFPELNLHMLETAVTDNHVFQKVKNVTKNYCKIRMYHLGREHNRKVKGENVRFKLNKLVLFKNQ